MKVFTIESEILNLDDNSTFVAPLDSIIRKFEIIDKKYLDEI